MLVVLRMKHPSRQRDVSCDQGDHDPIEAWLLFTSVMNQRMKRLSSSSLTCYRVVISYASSTNEEGIMSSPETRLQWPHDWASLSTPQPHGMFDEPVFVVFLISLISDRLWRHVLVWYGYFLAVVSSFLLNRGWSSILVAMCFASMC